MDKLAELIRDSEVYGVIAALSDEGIVKCSDYDELDKLAADVSEVIGDDGYTLEKVALLGAVMGGYRAADLTREERNALRRKYDLDDDADLTLRNIGRGMIGNSAGFAAGTAMGGPVLGTAAGLLAAKLLTDKYSRREAERALRDRRERKRSKRR